uniref:Uncharacterized protein n=1 Tax=Plectus sambesii TaxID=2011161 RepID=A0A914UH13_9BILA
MAAALYLILLIAFISKSVLSYQVSRLQSSNVAAYVPEVPLMERQTDGADVPFFQIQRLKQGLADRLRYRSSNEQSPTQIDRNCFMSPVQCLLPRGARFLL